MEMTLQRCIDVLDLYTKIIFNYSRNVTLGRKMWVDGIPPAMILALKTSISINEIQFCHLVGAEEILNMVAQGEFPLITNLAVSHSWQPDDIDIDITALCALLKSTRSSIMHVLILSIDEDRQSYIDAVADALEDPRCKVKSAAVHYQHYLFQACIKRRQIRNTLVALVPVFSRDILRTLAPFIL
jgi:hypothetical protein